MSGQSADDAKDSLHAVESSSDARAHGNAVSASFSRAVFASISKAGVCCWAMSKFGGSFVELRARFSDKFRRRFRFRGRFIRRPLQRGQLRRHRDLL
jgi:hypothetical protein